MDHNTEPRRAKPAAVVFALLGALLLALAVTAGLYILGTRQEGPASEKPASEGEAKTLSLFTSDQRITNTPPESAAAPAVGESAAETEGYAYEEIIAEEPGLRIARVQGKRYKGLIAEITDTSRLTVGTCAPFGICGKTVKEMADENGAVLAINGGEFSDPNGAGNGGEPIGNVIVDGEVLWGGGGATVGMDYDGKLYAGWFTADYCKGLNMKWALSYGPTLIVDGELQDVTDNLSEPRTAVGQRADGTVVFMCIAGRQPAALGVTNRQMALIMQEYGCVNAGNLDGGASSYMVYRGEYINISNTGGSPRPVPTSILLLPAAGEG